MKFRNSLFLWMHVLWCLLAFISLLFCKCWFKIFNYDWRKIATQHLIPELSGTRLTPKLCSRVADAFVSKYGKYAGWAQTLLFIAELPAQKAILPASKNDKFVKEKGRMKRSQKAGSVARKWERLCIYSCSMFGDIHGHPAEYHIKMVTNGSFFVDHKKISITDVLQFWKHQLLHFRYCSNFFLGWETRTMLLLINCWLDSNCITSDWLRNILFGGYVQLNDIFNYLVPLVTFAPLTLRLQYGTYVHACSPHRNLSAMVDFSHMLCIIPVTLMLSSSCFNFFHWFIISIFWTNKGFPFGYSY